MIQLDALKKRPERQTDIETNRQTNKQKLKCRSSANFVSAGQKGLILKNEKYESLSIKRIRILRNNLKTAEITDFPKIV